MHILGIDKEQSCPFKGTAQQAVVPLKVQFFMHYKCYANAKFMKLHILGNFNKFWSVLKMNATDPYIRNSNYAQLHTESGLVNLNW